MTQAERPGFLRRFLKRAGGTLLIIAALGVGNLVINYTPDVDTAERPFLRSGEQGEMIDARTFKVTLLKTRTAAVVSSDGIDHHTQGYWVLLRIRVETVSEPHTVGWAALIDSKGRSFRATDRIKQPLVDGSRLLQPGVAVEAEAVFEVPSDAGGFTARFAASRFQQTMQAVPDIAVPLGEGVWLDRDAVTPDAMVVAP
jgi:hypothetical protein